MIQSGDLNMSFVWSGFADAICIVLVTKRDNPICICGQKEMRLHILQGLKVVVLFGSACLGLMVAGFLLKYTMRAAGWFFFWTIWLRPKSKGFVLFMIFCCITWLGLKSMISFSSWFSHVSHDRLKAKGFVLFMVFLRITWLGLKVKLFLFFLSEGFLL